MTRRMRSEHMVDDQIDILHPYPYRYHISHIEIHIDISLIDLPYRSPVSPISDHILSL